MTPEAIDKACDDLRKAMKGLGTDEAALIRIIAPMVEADRTLLLKRYKERIKRDLLKDLSSETSFHFKDVLLLLFKTEEELHCKYLYDSMHGLGTNEELLMEQICTKTNEELRKAKELFPTLYKKDLCKYVESDTSGYFRKLLLAILQCNRSENLNVDYAQCKNDANALYKAGEKRLGTDEDTFVKIFSQRSFAELTQIMNCYTQISKKSLYQAIDSEFSGSIKKALKVTLQAASDLPGYFAERLNHSMKGLGTKDKELIRIIVTRCDIDMDKIRDAYKFKYNKELIKDIKGDTSGDYEKILVVLANK